MQGANEKTSMTETIIEAKQGFIGSVIPGRLLLSSACFRFTENFILSGHLWGTRGRNQDDEKGILPKAPKSDKLTPARYNFAPPCAAIFNCRVHSAHSSIALSIA
jgi:hypothetical protein